MGILLVGRIPVCLGVDGTPAGNDITDDQRAAFNLAVIDTGGAGTADLAGYRINSDNGKGIL
jgi:hypothetical protein